MTEEGRHRTKLAMWSGALVAGTAASWFRYSMTRSLLGTAGRFRWTFIALAVLCMGLAIAGWIAWSFKRDTRVPETLLLRWVLATWCVTVWALPLTSSDLFAHLAYGRLHTLGMNSYQVGPVALPDQELVNLVYWRWRTVPNIYGPVTTLVLWGCAEIGAWLGAPLVGGAIAIRLAMLLITAGTLLIAWLHAVRSGSEARSGFVAIALSPLLAWELVAQGHNDAVMVFSLALFFLLAAQERRAAAVAALSVAVLAKLTAGPLLLLYLLYLWRRLPRQALALSLLPPLIAAVAYWPFWEGPGILLGSSSFLADTTRTANSVADLARALFRTSSPSTVKAFYWVATAVSIGAPVAIVGHASVKRLDLAGIARAWAAAVLAWYLYTPWSQPWYVTWVLPTLMVEKDPQWRDFFMLLSILVVAQGALPMWGWYTNVGLVAWATWRLAALLIRARSSNVEAG